MRFLPFTDLLSNIVDNRGRTCPVAESGIPLIATNCVKNCGLFPTFEKVRYVDENTYKTWFRGHPKPGDLVFVTKGSPGQVCLVPDPVPFCIAQDMVAIRANPDVVYPNYLFAALRSPDVQKAISNMHVGTLIPHFKKGDFSKLSIPVPEMPLQQIVGDTFIELSTKIELNRRMNATLESMARALFRDWFVDFGPTRAKIEGVEPYLAPELWSLFPDRLDGDGKPEGWEVSTIGDEVRVVGGSTPSTKKPAFWDGGINWATPKDLSTLAAPVLLETARTITEAGLEKISSGLLSAGTVLLSSRAPIGYLAISEVPVAVNQGFIAMTCDKRLSNVFVWLWTQESMEAIKANANGSTFQEISKRNFRPLPVIVPPAPILQAFDAIIQPLYERIAQNEHESRTLAQTRDLLLPRLMSGELRVAGAETLASKVA